VSFTQLPQELVRGNEERVLLEDAADDDHRVGPHDVDNDLPAKLGEIVDSYDRVLISRQNIIQPRLVLHQVVDARSIFEGPFHVRDQPSEREPLLSAAVEDLLDQREHPVLIEVTIAQISASPVA
jgi:hypothetical protein